MPSVVLPDHRPLDFVAFRPLSTMPAENFSASHKRRCVRGLQNCVGLAGQRREI
jgi:hypothetical protein